MKRYQLDALKNSAVLVEKTKILTVAALSALIVACGGANNDITSLLPNAMSLEEGDIVRLNGVSVGKVTSLELESAGVKIGMDIEDAALELIDSNATTSVLGGKDPFISIKNPADLTNPVKEGSELAYSPTTVGGLAGLTSLFGGDLGAALSGALGDIQSSIESQDWAALNGALENTMEDLTRNGTELGSAVENTIGPILENFEGSVEELAPQIEAFSEDLANQLGDGSGELQSTIEGVLGQLLDSMARGIEKGQQSTQ